MHIALALLEGKPVEGLRFGDRAEGRDGHDLRLSAGEHRAAVRAAEDADLAPDGADLILRAPVGADLLVDDLIAHDFLGDVVEDRADVLGAFRIFLLEGFNRLRLDRVAAHFALVTVKGIQRPDDLVKRIRADFRFQLFVGMVDHRLHLFFADLGFDVRNEADDLLDLFVRKEDRVEHIRFRNLVRARFDHHDRVLGSRDDEA